MFNRQVRRNASIVSPAALFRSANIIDDSADDVKGALGLNLLYSPSEHLIDFIFVHGLGGGSRKTWSKTSSIAHFWPQEWLPKDPAFKNVRIHSFGYNANWGESRDSILGIHDFGKSLLGEISTSPHIMGNEDTPIVLIGHSMGGLVLKKAYILARQDPSHHALAKRFHTAYFLATPHCGSDSAKLLKNILRAYGSRPYLGDLERNSGALQSINDEFKHYSDDLSLWSFYETLKTNLGVTSALIVDRDSATLGYGREQAMLVNANHRGICKFDQPTDPNYKLLRNALALTVESISKKVLQSKEQLWRNQIRDLEKFLGVTEKPEDDLVAVEDARIPGSCEWISTKKSYSQWRDLAPESPRVFWLNAKPAAGKSVLAGYIIDQLEETNSDCSYYFFKYGEKSKSRLSTCLRSIAYQMALMNVRVREKLLAMHKDDVSFDMGDERAIWRKLFLTGIFQTEFPRHYWIIDALDECVNFASLFAPMLAKLDKSMPLRILITSRQTPELEKQFLSLGPVTVHAEEISIADTLPDMRLLVEAKMEFLPAADDEDRDSLIGKIMGKSEGCFLWTVLVLQELANTYGEEETKQVLDEVPQDMDPLYLRTLEQMSQAPRGKKLAKAILAWATCSVRPLTTKEMEGALKLDIKDNFPNLEKPILALCGQLVHVDKLGKVQMVHQTARELLLSDGLESEFAVNRLEAHTRIARTCLVCLTGEDMKPPRTWKRTSVRPMVTKRSEFLTYACAAFSEHLASSDPFADDVLVLLDKFLKSNVLSWIELVARTQNLITLIRAAKNLRVYVESRAKYFSPLGEEMQTIRGWSTDLIRVAARFSDALLISPSAIYGLIQPFCPTESAVYKATSMAQSLTVMGLLNAQWGDRLSCIDFHGGQTSALSYGDQFFAVGLFRGTVTLYHKTSCQEYKVLEHGEPVRLLQFQGGTDFMASCGLKTIRIWDTRGGETLHTFCVSQRCMALTFDKNLLIAALYGNYLASWDLKDGSQRPHRPWHDTVEKAPTASRRPPTAASISPEHKMLAVGYRGKPITLWDLENESYYGNCGKELANGQSGEGPYLVSTLAFNPNPEFELLVAAYSDGDLVLFDISNGRAVGNIRTYSHTLASSPDGRTLVGGDAFGTIHILEFDTLKLLYRIIASPCNIKQLAFSKDSLSLVDIRESQCNVWEPPVLIRDGVGDHGCETISTSASSREIGLNYKIRISAMELHPSGQFAFCGNNDGYVALYELQTGTLVRTLYHHTTLCFVRILTWSEAGGILMSLDASNTIIASKLDVSHANGRRSSETVLLEGCRKLFRCRVECDSSVVQILPNDQWGKLVVSTRETDYLWSIDGKEIETRVQTTGRSIRKWLNHPQSQDHMICFEGSVARIYNWSDWAEVASVSLHLDVAGLRLKRILPCVNGRRILVEFSEQDGSGITRSLNLLETSSLQPENKSEEAVSVPLAEYTTLEARILHVIGIYGLRLVFLDEHSWVCSASLEFLGGFYVRHFFVPHAWFLGPNDFICAVTGSKGDVVFVQNDEIAVVKGGFEFEERIEIDEVVPVPNMVIPGEPSVGNRDLEVVRGKMRESSISG